MNILQLPVYGYVFPYEYLITSANKKIVINNTKKLTILFYNFSIFVLFQLSNILSALELLPNEVYEMILKCISGQDKLNIRITCKG